MPRDDFGRSGRLLEPTIRRYDKAVRRRLRKMARGSSRLGDLIVAWPAAAYALAIGRGSVAERGVAVRLVKEGAGLREVAEALALPAWTRKLAPEAFRQGFGALPASALAARQLPSLAPDGAEAAACWFEWVAAAQHVGGEAAALWAARQRALLTARRPEPVLMAPIGAWIWLSDRPERGAARAIERGWGPQVSLKAACRETAGWLERLIEVHARKARREPERGAWFKPQNVAGFKISPRRTPEELLREGEIMNHCVGTYAGLVQKGVCLIYSVRRGGAPVATVEIRARPDGSGRGEIVQLQGPSNTPVDSKTRRAVETWLKRQGPCPLRAQGAPRAAEIDAARWSALVAPLRAADVGGDVFRALFPAEPTDEALLRLSRLGRALAHHAEA